ncbi:hypothetical protein PoB_004450700 [Plakobranchus ocellatus]|uniref:Uncharacterized protein n=1 Tax=Plakobranchus ocellatus TaxID=259542 RepID=A0AAV4BGB5_9GAST|nr:hypothetical protein PoB_004450700 [Plakobranchus ocellatus]
MLDHKERCVSVGTDRMLCQCWTTKNAEDATGPQNQHVVSLPWRLTSVNRQHTQNEMFPCLWCSTCSLNSGITQGRMERS